MKQKNISIAFAFLLLLIYAALIVSAFTYFDAAEFFNSITSKRSLFSIKLSLLTASLATVLAMCIAIPAGYGLARYKFFGRELIDISLELPLIISPAALGAMILIFFSTSSGVWFQEHVIQVVYTFWGIVIAQFVTILGIATRMVKTTLEQIPERLEQVARTLGASPRKVFFTITLPLAKQGLFSASILTWAKAFGEFGATFTLAGTMAMKTETIPVSVFMKLSNADIQGSVAMIMVLISVGMSLLALARVKF
jgi:molybdate transport system permease protein